MSREFSDLQAALIRERLICLFSFEFNRASVREILTDIVCSEATSYDASLLDDQSIKNYDKLLPLKNDTLENFLTRETRHPRSELLEELFLYLKDKEWISDDEILAIGSQPESKLPISITSNLSRDEAAIEVSEGEFFYDERAERSYTAQVMLTVRARRKNYMSCRRRNISFERAASETTEVFYTRCRQGKSNTDETYNGSITPLNAKKALLLDTADGEFFSTQTLQNVYAPGIIFLEASSPEKRIKLQDFRNLEDNLQKYMYLRIIKSGIQLLFMGSISNKVNIKIMNSINTNNDILLLESAERNDILGMLRALLLGADINVRDSSNGYTAMHWAAQNCSDEAFAILTMRQEEVELIQNVFLQKLSEEFGDVEAMTHQLRDIGSERDALAKDFDGYLPSSRIAGLNISRSDPENLAKKAFWDRMMSVEFKAANDLGQNFFDIIGNGGQPFFPGLEFD
tara:strand:- start:31505 stop:32878 length:1374 start_codon:yes stop_codon:yes gene_type:complete